MTVERAVSWTALLAAIVAGALRFGRVETLKDDLGGSIHALTTSVAVLTAEVRNLSAQLEKREKQR